MICVLFLMHRFIVLCICILVCSSQSDANNSSSSTVTNETCLEIGLWTIWFDVNNTHDNSTEDNSSTYLDLVRIANDTCTVPIGIQIQLSSDLLGTRRIQRSWPESTDFGAFLSLYWPLLNGLNFRVRYCCEIDSAISTTTTTEAASTMTATDKTVTNVSLTSSDGAICGKQEITPGASLTTRIFGGTDAIANSWPWMISFRQKATCETTLCYIVCGATLINKDYVITAAHCIRTTNPADIILIAGMHNQSSRTESDKRQVRTVQAIHIHPQFQTTTYSNDIALLRVNTSFIYTTYVQPACLPGAEPQSNDQVVIVGWGSEIVDGIVADTLKQAYTTVVGNCNYYWRQVRQTRQICVANSISGDSACQGDSGGPIFSEDNGQYVVSGVASFVSDCNTMGDDNAPNVYTRVSAYKTWIENIIG